MNTDCLFTKHEFFHAKRLLATKSLKQGPATTEMEAVQRRGKEISKDTVNCLDSSLMTSCAYGCSNYTLKNKAAICSGMSEPR